jgi:hypothetical protein
MRHGAEVTLAAAVLGYPSELLLKSEVQGRFCTVEGLETSKMTIQQAKMVL